MSILKNKNLRQKILGQVDGSLCGTQQRNLEVADTFAHYGVKYEGSIVVKPVPVET